MTPPLSEEQIADIRGRAKAREIVAEHYCWFSAREVLDLLATIDHLKSLPQTEGVGAAPRGPSSAWQPIGDHHKTGKHWLVARRGQTAPPLRAYYQDGSWWPHLAGPNAAFPRELIGDYEPTDAMPLPEPPAVGAPQGINTPPSQKMEDV